MRLCPRFSLRTLFVLIAIASVPLGWLACQLNWIRARQQVAVKHHMIVAYLMTQTGTSRHTFSWPQPRPNAPWQLGWLREKGYAAVEVRKGESEDEFARIRQLFPEADVSRMEADE